MGQFPDEGLLAKVEGQAIDMAREAGAILSRYFGKPLDVEYKDKHEQDPVTAADKDSQEYLEQAISEAFPDHGVLGEEDREREREDTPLPDFLWVLDPLDGTKNFLSGLPIYACSVGVLYHGNPVVGAVFLPWPGDGAGAVLHARRGGGAFMDREPISVSPLEEPKANSLVTVPGSFGANFRFRKPMRGRIGEMRVTGSIAYELAMTARGVLQYSVTTGPHLWDVAAGIVLVLEAGGIAMWRKRGGGVKSLFGSSRWEPVESLVPSWQSGQTTAKELRRWTATMVLGSPGVVRYVTSNMRPRLILRHRLARSAHHLFKRPPRDKNKVPG